MVFMRRCCHWWCMRSRQITGTGARPWSLGYIIDRRNDRQLINDQQSQCGDSGSDYRFSGGYYTDCIGLATGWLSNKFFVKAGY